MRMFQTLFLPFCFCVLVLVLGVSSFAVEGNGVERGAVIEWADVAGMLRPEMRKAIEESLQKECPQLSQILANDVLVVHTLQLIPTGAQVHEPQGAPILELTFRLGSDEARHFKVRMATEPPRGFVADEEPEALKFKVTILEWIGAQQCFGPALDAKEAGQ